LANFKPYRRQSHSDNRLASKSMRRKELIR
jgi:hypothetical protein